MQVLSIYTLSGLFYKSLIARGRIFSFNVQLPDKPGELLNIAKILADENANVVKLDHDQALVTNSFKKVLLGVTVETHNLEHIDKIVEALHKNNYKIEKINLLR